MIDLTEVVTKWRDGALVEELNETLQGLIAACIDTEKQGELTLKLKIEPYKAKNGGYQVDITPKVESKNPRFDPGKGIFHVVTDEDGRPVGLEREDPRQTAMFEQMKKELREV